jgi:predicted nucleic acid-binding protein
MPKIVIADTSFLIAIQKLQLFSQIKSLYKEIYVTPTIANEFKLKLPDWIIIREPDNLQVAKVLSIVLDPGEASALALAYSFSDTVLILDDLKARKEALKLGFKITGTLGVLYRLQQEGIIDSLKNQLKQLTELGFRISPKIIEEILKSGQDGA